MLFRSEADEGAAAGLADKLTCLLLAPGWYANWNSDVEAFWRGFGSIFDADPLQNTTRSSMDDDSCLKGRDFGSDRRIHAPSNTNDLVHRNHSATNWSRLLPPRSDETDPRIRQETHFCAERTGIRPPFAGKSEHCRDSLLML